MKETYYQILKKSAKTNQGNYCVNFKQNESKLISNRMT